VLEREAGGSTFVNGFNKEDALSEFVNAGDGNDCADHKIRGKTFFAMIRIFYTKTPSATFNLGFEDVQCRHIVFGGSADNGYARLLGPHVKPDKVSLLNGPPFAREWVEITRN
jgi:hypothetical protein